ncbi:MAG TPA: hypothetical protein VFN53_09165, partial [Acidobacteriaceae bacterium]|nr:hypothetical protein [Acidobacteriaceae bacterium]
DAVRAHRSVCAGEIYNVGGGQERAVSVLQVLETIRDQYADSCSWSFDKVRPGDQPIYVTDFRKLGGHTGWEPRKSFESILDDLYAFWQENRSMLGRQRNAALADAVPSMEQREILERQLA